MNAAESQTVEQPSQPAQCPRRSLSFRFGLRGLLIFGLVFCLIFGWVGRNLHRMRQEDLALEKILNTGGAYISERNPSTWINSTDRRSSIEIVSRLAGYSTRPHIRRAELRSVGPNDAALGAAVEALVLFPEIQEIGLRGEGVDDRTMERLKRLSNLRTVWLVETRVSGAGLAKLGPGLRIETLSIEGNVIGAAPSPAVLTGLATWANLEDLSVTDMPIARAEIETIASLPRLDTLRLNALLPVATDVFAPLGRSSSLKYLFILDSGFADADVASVAELSGLDTLALDGVTDDGIERLALLPNLEFLYLDDPVTAAGARAHSAAYPQRLVMYESPPDTYLWFRAGEELHPYDWKNEAP